MIDKFDNANMYTRKKRGRNPKQILKEEHISENNFNVADIQQDHMFMQDIEEDILNDKDKTLIKKNNIIKERLITIDKILEMYPSLKKDRTLIVDNILNKKEHKVEDFILEKVKIDDGNYYFDLNGNIIDEDVNLVGFFIKNKEKYAYCLFSDNAKRMILLENNINKFIKMSNDFPK